MSTKNYTTIKFQCDDKSLIPNWSHSREQHEELIKQCNPEYGGLLLTKVGTTVIAKVICVNIDFSIFVSLALLKSPKILISHYSPLLNIATSPPK